MRINQWTVLVGTAMIVAGMGAEFGWCGSGEDAFVAFVGENYLRASSLARPATKNGDVVALYVMARLYDESAWAEHNETKAAEWWQRTLQVAQPTVEKESPQGQFVLSRMYALGKGVEKNEALGVDLCRKAAECHVPGIRTPYGPT